MELWCCVGGEKETKLESSIEEILQVDRCNRLKTQALGILNVSFLNMLR